MVKPNKYFVTSCSWDGSVSMVTRLWAGWSGVWSPVGIRDFSILQNIQMDSEAHPPPY
jgi:hypothetical protein